MGFDGSGDLQEFLDAFRQIPGVKVYASLPAVVVALQQESHQHRIPFSKCCSIDGQPFGLS